MLNRGFTPFLFSFLFALSLAPFSLLAQEPEPEDLYAKGFDMMMERKFERALPLWERLVKERPTNVQANYFLGACLHRTSDRRLEGIPPLELAVEYAVPAKDFNPKLDEKNVPMNVHYLLADLYHLDYQFEKAIKHYKIFRKKEAEKHVKEMPEPVERKIAMCKQGLKLKKNPRKVRIENLGEKVNSSYKEHSPVVNLDETTLYFTSRRLRKDSSNEDLKVPGTGQYKEDIYVSYKKDGEWQEPKMLDLSTEEHEATINLSKDGRSLFAYKDLNENGDIYKAERDEEGLGELQKLGDHVNSKDAYEEHLDVSADNDVLYFSSDREGGKGGMDLYMVKKLPTGDWAKPQNLGPTINTEHDEDAPFIHPDGKTLYFSSSGHNTMGAHDIFKTQQNEDGTWQDPVNVGYPINSPDDDIYFVTTPDGKRAYYSSDFKGFDPKGGGEIKGYGSSDLYLLEFPEAKEKNLTLLKGVIKPGNCEDLLANIQILVERKKSRELVNQLIPRTRDGGYVSILPPGETYTITYMHKDQVFYTDEIEVKEKSSYQEIKRAINLDTLNFDCSRGKVALAQNVKDEGEKEGSADKDGKKDGDGEKTSLSPDEAPFPEPYERFYGYNESDLTTREEKFSSFIEKLVKSLKARDSVVALRVVGSASKVPTETFETNEKLARARAENAKKRIESKLSEHGVDPDAYRIEQVEGKVQGPDYKGDFENKEKYGDYQFIKVEVIR